MSEDDPSNQNEAPTKLQIINMAAFWSIFLNWWTEWSLMLIEAVALSMKLMLTNHSLICLQRDSTQKQNILWRLWKFSMTSICYPICQSTNHLEKAEWLDRVWCITKIQINWLIAWKYWLGPWRLEIIAQLWKMTSQINDELLNIGAIDKNLHKKFYNKYLKWHNQLRPQKKILTRGPLILYMTCHHMPGNARWNMTCSVLLSRSFRFRVRENHVARSFIAF